MHIHLKQIEAEEEARRSAMRQDIAALEERLQLLREAHVHDLETIRMMDEQRIRWLEMLGDLLHTTWRDAPAYYDPEARFLALRLVFEQKLQRLAMLERFT
jgi:hypothetical protein